MWPRCPALSLPNAKDVVVKFMDRGENKVVTQHEGKVAAP